MRWKAIDGITILEENIFVTKINELKYYVHPAARIEEAGHDWIGYTLIAYGGKSPSVFAVWNTRLYSTEPMFYARSMFLLNPESKIIMEKAESLISENENIKWKSLEGLLLSGTGETINKDETYMYKLIPSIIVNGYKCKEDNDIKKYGYALIAYHNDSPEIVAVWNAAVPKYPIYTYYDLTHKTIEEFQLAIDPAQRRIEELCKD